MKVLFTHAYFLKEDEKEQEIMRPYVPLGILYLSAYLEERKVQNEVFDSTFESKQAQLQYIDFYQPDVIAIYTNLMTKLNVLELIKKIKSKKEWANIRIVLGGPDVTYNIQDYLKNGADFLVIGEGEVSLYELCRGLEAENTSLKSIPGLAFMENGEVIRTVEREKIKNIDSLPLPNRKKIDLKLYLSAWKNHHGYSSLTVSTQRGCPYTCKWCSTAVYGMSYRRRSPALVVQELAELQKLYQPDSFWFVDDVFTVSHKWLNAFAEEVEKAAVKIQFECISRADRMSEEVLLMLKRAGCIRIWIGAESGSQKIIDAMDRRVSVNQVREMIQLSKKHGIESGTFIMLGYPGETQEDIDLTVEHLVKSNPDHFTITVAYPIKGTALFQQVEEMQLSHPEWNNMTDRDRDFHRTYSKRYYEYAVKHVVNEVNYQKAKTINRHWDMSGIKHLLKSKVSRSIMNWERLTGKTNN